MELRRFLVAVLGGLASIYFASTQESLAAAAPITAFQTGTANAQNNAIKFETAAQPLFAIQSRFSGTAVVSSNTIQVHIDSGVLSFPVRGKPGDSRHIEEYHVSLSTRSTNGWSGISHSKHVAVQRELPFGQEIILTATNLTIPLENISSRTNHWLTFSISTISQNNPEGGYCYSHSKRDLFTNLSQTTLQAPPWTEVRAASSTSRFIQRNWTNFPTVNFLKPTNGSDTVFQNFKVSEHVVGQFRERYYSGVRFTVPEWMDGDLEFAFVHLYRNARGRRPGYAWDITAESGEFSGMGEVDRVFFDGLPETQALYPFTEKGYTGGAKRRHFMLGKTYVLWWAHYWNGNEGVVPDLALALTIVSERGRKEFGEITWR